MLQKVHDTMPPNNETTDNQTANNAAPPTDDLPAGDSPPPPAWQFPLAMTAWTFWFIFILCMVWVRFKP